MWIDLVYADGRRVFTNIGNHTVAPPVWRVPQVPAISIDDARILNRSMRHPDLEFWHTEEVSHGLAVYRQRVTVGAYNGQSGGPNWEIPYRK